MKKLLLAAAAALAVCLPIVAAQGAEGDGAVSISVREYERLKALEEGDQKKQYWKMSFEQILGKENNNYTKAWEIYEFWVLRKIYLDGAVNGGSVDRIVAKINTLNKLGTTPITLVIRSPGGSVLDGMTLLNAMSASIAPVNTVCDSYAFSMGAVAFAFGRHRVAEEGCVFMIHEVSVGAPGGRSIEHVKWGDTVLNIESQLVGVLSRVSGLDTKEVRTLMEYETFWSVEEVCRLGFADECYIEQRDVAERDIPPDLMPRERMRRNYDEKLTP